MTDAIERLRWFLGPRDAVTLGMSQDAAALAEQLHEERHDALDRLETLVRAAEERPCNRFDVTPCSERPEIREEDWCVMCRALRAVKCPVCVDDGEAYGGAGEGGRDFRAAEDLVPAGHVHGWDAFLAALRAVKGEQT